MIPVQPHNIFSYISWKKKKIELSSAISRLYYLSWEDAMWDIIKHKKVPIGSVALIPSFWCGDVVKNMHAHGVVCVHYECDQNFQTYQKTLEDAIKKHSPKIIIVFHAVGIENQLLKENIDWLQTIPEETTVIEDSVHSIINPSEVQIMRNNHFVIDSWRKVIPLQGSALYGRSEDITWVEPPYTQSFFYMISIVFLWVVFQLALWIESKTSGKLAQFLGKCAEMAMTKGYDIIGENTDAAPTLPIFVNLHKKIDIEKIEKTKKEQVEVYESKLGNLSKEGLISVRYREIDKGRLRGYPLGLRIDVADKILAAMRGAGLYVRFELNDSPWSQNQKVIFLPLGPHLREKDIDQATQILMRSTLS